MKITTVLGVAIGLAGLAACGGGEGAENAEANADENLVSATDMNMGGTGFENETTSGAGTGSTGYGGTAGPGMTDTEGDNADGANAEDGNADAGNNE